MLTYDAEALPHNKRTMRGRRLVLVDIENLVGGGQVRAADATALRRRLALSGLLSSGDQVVIASSHANGVEAAVGWGVDARLVVQSGIDGADLALIEVLESECIAERFGAVTLASGDGIFAQPVAALAEHGVDVTIVSREDACSRRLRLAARSSVLWHDERHFPLEAA